MHRAIPRGKKVLAKRQEERKEELHNKKLAEVRSQVDVAAPNTYGVLRTKPKKDQQLEERYSEIERNNKLLLDRMTSIIGSTDRKNQYSNPTLNSIPVAKQSLHSNFRKRELQRITQENYKILQRLKEKESHYSVAKWEGDRRRTENYLNNICEYPHMFTGEKQPPRRSISPPRVNPRQPHYNTSESSGNPHTHARSGSLPRLSALSHRQNNPSQLEDSAQEGAVGSGGSEISQVVSQAAGPKGPLLPIDLRAEGVDNERKVLYRKMHSQGRNDYMIEISKTKAKYYVVSVLMNRSRKVQILDFHLKQGKKLIR